MLRSCFLSSFVEFRSAGFRGEVKNVSANQMPGRPSCFSDRPEKHKLGRGCWSLSSCQVSLNSGQRFQRRSRKCLSQSEARAAILFFRSARKNTNLVEDVEILLPVKFRWIPLSGFRVEVENVSANQRPGRTSCFTDRPEKHKLGRGHWDLASGRVFVEFRSVVSEEKSKISQPIRGQGGHLDFQIRRKHKLGRGRWDLASCQV